MSDVHDLKTDPQPFQAVHNGYKTFELRWDDRGFKLGDTLRLLEHIRYNPKDLVDDAKTPEPYFTGRVLEREVSYILRAPKYGLTGKWCVMALKVPR